MSDAAPLEPGVVRPQGRTVEQLAEILTPGRPPTAEQHAIIGAGDEPTLVVAGAGSGKTETLSMRIVYLLDHAHELFGRPISPDEILCLTFTRKAAAEIAERADARISAVWDPEVTGADGRVRRMRDPERPAPTVATYNAYASALAAEHGLRVGVDPDSTVLTDAALWQLAARTLEEWTAGLDSDSAPSTILSALPRLSAQMREHGVPPQVMRDWLTGALAQLDALPKKEGEKVPGPMTKALAGRVGKLRTLLSMLDLVDDFRARKHAGALLDFSDQVAIAVELAELPAVREAEQARFRAVLLDEFQDTSPAQLRLFSRMFGTGHPVMAVGDPNQAIYGFRGASAAALEDFVTEFGGPQRVAQASLSVSWRNEASILHVANTAADPLRDATAVPVERLISRGEHLATPEPVRQAPGVSAHMAATAQDEAEHVVEYLLDRRRELGHGLAERAADGSLKRDGAGRPAVKIVEAAILCRRRATIPAMVDALAARGVDYEVVGLGGLLDTPDVADLVALLEVAHDPSRGDSLMRLLTSERIDLGPRDLMALQDWAEHLAGPRKHRESGPSIVDALAQEPPPDFASDGRALTDEARRRLASLRRAVDQIRQHTYLPLTELIAFAERVWGLDIEADVASPEGRIRRNVDAFLDAARTFAQGAEHVTLGAFLHWLDAARSEERGLDAPVKEPEPGAVQLLTVHSAKGLEWDVVAVPGAVDGAFPSVNGKRDAFEDGAWLAGDPALPWELRMDSRSLPDWHWRSAVDHATLAESIQEFRRAAGAHAVDEERRLFYVALTRARSHVLVSGSWFTSGKTIRRPSLFIDELVDAGLVSREGWAPEPDPDAPPPDPRIEEGVWPRPETAPQRRRRLLARAVLGSEPGAPAHEQSLPLADQLAAMLAEGQERRGAAHEVQLPAHLSTSALVSMRRDRDEFARQLRRPVPQEPTAAAHRGSALHAWIEARYGQTALWDDDDLGPGEDDSADLDELKRTFESSEWASRVPTHVEVDVELPVGGLSVRSRIDAVFPAGAGLDRITVVDWKSGRPPRDPQEKAAREVQLAMYRLAWSARTGLPLDQIDAAFYYVAADVTVRPASLMDRAEIEHLIRGA
ncbi:ATP-dependent DNA helicase [Demequina zhanjiangensis]|uniref:DNA 3'-5' helicase n=1 Tax=Demequina zhanjiangensis TaxID=3051659 RepID=A0ABT8FXV5_9MICO|nr:ATP-dependent DNA helicase [Demequina sp. SYSU T00b26]MDN4471647.1 ATP-dependent DNA helicase [Demequina sp. SYSU T00b26]